MQDRPKYFNANQSYESLKFYLLSTKEEKLCKSKDKISALDNRPKMTLQATPVSYNKLASACNENVSTV